MRNLFRVVATMVIALIAFGIVFVIGGINETTDVDRAFTISQFDRAVLVEPDGTTYVQEIIDVTFHESRRGIFRDLEDETRFAGGSWQIVSVDAGSDDTPWHYAVETGPYGPRVRVGEASIWLDRGAYRYRLRMLAPTWSHLLGNDDDAIVETRIDVPGYAWPTSVNRGTLWVRVPGEVLGVDCVEGHLRTVTPCAGDVVVDGDTVTVELGPYEPWRSATVAIRSPAAAFTAPLPTYDAVTLGSWSPAALLPDSALTAALLAGLVILLPLLVIDLMYSVGVYRDRVTDPAVHHQATPTAVFAPPRGLDPAATAGLLLRRSSSPLFLAKLVDLDQRGLITTTSTEKSKKVELTVARNPDADPEAMGELDRAFIDALLPASGEIRFTGTYNASVAKRVSNATSVMSRHANNVFRDQQLEHDAGGALRNSSTKALLGLGVAGWAIMMAVVFSRWSPLRVGSMVAIVIVIVAAWAVAHTRWAKFRLPLNSQGRKTIAEAKAFREFIRTVEAEQLDWAAGQPGVNHLHPALSLLPYAIVFGLADSWFRRFSGVMAQLSATAPTAAAAAAPAWWASQSGFSGVRSAQSSTTTAPSSSGSGGGGGGSGGGGGGGGSW